MPTLQLTTAALHVNISSQRDAYSLGRQSPAVWQAEKVWRGTLEPQGPLTQAVPGHPSQVCSYLLTTLPAPPIPAFISGTRASLPLTPAPLSGGFTLSHFFFLNLSIPIAYPFLSPLPAHSLRPGVTSQTLLSVECKVTGVSKFKKHRAEDNFSKNRLDSA